MGCSLSKKIIYWTGIYSPKYEAVSKEIQLLRSHTGGTVYGISSMDFLKFSLKEKYLVHFNRPYRLVGKLVPWFELRHDVSHIFHSFDNPVFLKNLTKKPIILTGATGGEILTANEYQHISFLVAESSFDYERLINKGHSPEKVKLIYPGVDFSQKITPESSVSEPERFTVLFASSPITTDYFKARGIDLLLETAVKMPNVNFIMLWREWPDTVTVIKEMLQTGNHGKGYPNVQLKIGNVTDIASWYMKAHCVATPFCTEERSKPCPNSVLEGMALGKPALVSSKVGIQKLIQESGAGIVFEPHPENFANAIRKLSRNYQKYQKECIPTVTKHFSQESFLKSYQSLYDQL